MKLTFYKTGNLNGSNYVKIPLRSSAILIIENSDKYCFIFSFISHLNPCENSHPTRVSNYEQYFNEFNIQGLDFTNGFKYSDLHRFEKLNNLSTKYK